MGFSAKRIGIYFTFLAALGAAGCGGHGSGSSNSSSTGAPITSGLAPVTSGAPVINNPGTTLPAGPELTSVRFDDVDGDSTVSAGDKLVCTFAADLEPIAAGADPASEFSLKVAGDSFGAGATVQAAAAANAVEIVLGSEPKLYVSATFDPASITAGEASGLNLAASTTLEGAGADGAKPAASDLDIEGTLAPKFHSAGNLNVARGSHASVTLDDGRILIVGGVAGGTKGDLVAEAELYDPATGSFTMVSSLSGANGYMKRGSVTVRTFLTTATKLDDGTVLICGGYGVERKTFFGLGSEKLDTLESAFLFNPADNTFKRVGDMKYPRHSHTATLLDDGRVLIAGGYNDSFWKSDKTQAPFEVYDPAKREFSKIGSIFSRFKMQDPRMNHTATPLAGGSAVLFAGGAHYEGGGLFGLIKPKLKMNTGGELVAGNKSARTGELSEPRLDHAAMALGADAALIAGGRDLTTGLTAGVELYETSTNAFRTVGWLQTPRAHPQIAWSRDEALIIGGHAGYGETAWVEVFDATSNQVKSGRYTLKNARNGCTVEQLTDSRVLVIGGFVGGVTSWLSMDGQALSSCEVFVSQ